jgi:hypothetical protein
MTADTSRTLVIESSPGLLAAGLVVGVLFTALAITVVLLPIPLWLKVVVGYPFVAFFAVYTGVFVSRLLTSPEPVITITPEGISDTRLAAQLIPWSDVTGISTLRTGLNTIDFGRKTMVLAIKSGVEERLGLTRMARWTRGFTRAFYRVDGLSIETQGLKIDYDTLLQTSLYYFRQHHG